MKAPPTDKAIGRALLILYADLDSVIRFYDGVPLSTRYGLIVDAWGRATEALDPGFSFSQFKAARRRAREADGGIR